MAWYYVDGGGNTQGPLTVDVMKQKFQAKDLTEESYVWNGTSVNQWTALKGVGELLKQIKPAQNSGGGGGGAPVRRRPNPFGGGGKGGRSSLLAAIQSKQALKKVEKKPDDAPKVGNTAPAKAKVGGMGGLGAAIAARRAKLDGGKGGGGAKKSYGGGAKKSFGAQPKPTTSSAGPKKKTWGKSTGPAKKWGKPTTTKPNTSKAPISSTTPSSSGGGRIGTIKNRLDNASEWQLKAIEAILGI